MYSTCSIGNNDMSRAITFSEVKWNWNKFASIDNIYSYANTHLNTNTYRLCFMYEYNVYCYWRADTAADRFIYFCGPFFNFIFKSIDIVINARNWRCHTHTKAIGIIGRYRIVQRLQLTAVWCSRCHDAHHPSDKFAFASARWHPLTMRYDNIIESVITRHWQ